MPSINEVLLLAVFERVQSAFNEAEAAFEAGDIATFRSMSQLHKQYVRNYKLHLERASASVH